MSKPNPTPAREPWPTRSPQPDRPVPPPRPTKTPTRIAALEVLMDPRDIAASDRLVAEAPPLTSEQISALRSLLRPADQSGSNAA